MKNEKKFYEAIQQVFTGSPVIGDGGFVNLLRIKEKYFRKVLEKFRSDIDSDSVITKDFKENFFDMLYTFFYKYFSECGSVYFVQTSVLQNVYEKIYTDNKDAVLFWKTNMLYYVKSDILFNNVYVTVNTPNTGIQTAGTDEDYVFYFDAGDLKQKQNNTKKVLQFHYKETKIGKIKDVHTPSSGDKTYVFSVIYKEGRDNYKPEEEAYKADIDKEILELAIKQFKKQTTVDFFINKDAEKFLNQQLDIYLHQYLLGLNDVFDQKRLEQVKTVKRYAQNLILFISQFENELARIWNKPKFVLNSNYVITIDKLPEAILEKLSKHSGIKDQIKEWIGLSIVDKTFKFDPKQMDLINYRYLPVDTKYFKDLEIEILGLFENLDDVLDGRLIHSENYQALNTLRSRYSNQMQCIYIDPPFNTGSDFEYLDNYQDSTWLSIMKDRLSAAKELLNVTGSFFLHLDRYAAHYGKVLMDDVFNKQFKNEIIWRIGWLSGLKTQYDAFIRNHDVIFYYGKDKKKTYFKKKLSVIPYKTNSYKDAEQEINAILKKANINKEEIRNINLTILNKDDSFVNYYPSNKEYKTGNYHIEDTWNSSPRESLDSNKIKRNVAEYTPNGSALTQKPEELLERIIKLTTDEKHYVLDFFSGSGTTAAVAHKMERKYIAIEMGDYFYTDILVRMKWVLNGKSVGISKKVNHKGGGFFKYYDLEQYEDTLSRMVYSEDKGELFSNDVFGQYVFFADQKLTDILKIDGQNINLDFTELFNGKTVDLAETVSLIYGKPILKITQDEVFLKDIAKPVKINTAKMTNEEKIDFAKILKPYLWWGK